MSRIWQDTRYALRMLVKSPAFAVVAILTLALGMGVNTALFSVANFMLQERPNGFQRPEELVQLWGQMISKGSAVGAGVGLLPFEAYPNYRAATEVFDLAGWNAFPAKASWRGSSMRVGTEVVSANYFDVLGVTPALGRGFRPDETEPVNGPPVAIVSDKAWHRHLDGARDVLGQTVKLNGQPFTIIGVGPKDFVGHSGADFWVPTAAYDSLFPQDAGALRTPHRWSWFFTGRLKANVALPAAQARVATIASNAAKEAGVVQTTTALLQPMIGGNDEERRSFLFVVGAFMALGGLVLLVACANVCNLLLARAQVRQREVAVRAALGASRARLFRQLLTESLLLAGLGGLVGLIFAYWTKNLIVSWWWPWLAESGGPAPAIDLRALGYTSLLLAVSTVLFGLVPAIRLSSVDLVSALKSAGGARGSRGRFSGALVVAQVSIAFALLVISGLLVQSLRAAQRSALGFDSHNLLTAGLDLNVENYPKERWQVFFKELRDKLGTLPGVTDASINQGQPLINGGNFTLFHLEGAAQDAGSQQAWYSWVDPQYFSTLRIPIIRGRNFEPTDDAERPGVAIVSKAFAEYYLAGQEPLGRVLTLDANRSTRAEIVGVTADAKFGDFRETNSRCVFLSLYQNARTSGNAGDVSLLLRTAGDPMGSITDLRNAVKQVAPDVLVMGGDSYDHVLDRGAFFIFRIGAVFALALATLAFVLALVGLYGLLAFAVSQRTREVGVRMALGADDRHVVWLFVRRGLILTASGLACGLLLALASRRLITAYLYGVSPTDPATFVVVPIAFGAIALLASYLPARRATRVDPMVALRME